MTVVAEGLESDNFSRRGNTWETRAYDSALTPTQIAALEELDFPTLVPDSVFAPLPSDDDTPLARLAAQAVVRSITDEWPTVPSPGASDDGPFAMPDLNRALREISDEQAVVPGATAATEQPGSWDYPEWSQQVHGDPALLAMARKVTAMIHEIDKRPPLRLGLLDEADRLLADIELNTATRLGDLMYVEPGAVPTRTIPPIDERPLPSLDEEPANQDSQVVPEAIVPPSATAIVETPARVPVSEPASAPVTRVEQETDDEIGDYAQSSTEQQPTASGAMGDNLYGSSDYAKLDRATSEEIDLTNITEIRLAAFAHGKIVTKWEADPKTGVITVIEEIDAHAKPAKPKRGRRFLFWGRHTAEDERLASGTPVSALTKRQSKGKTDPFAGGWWGSAA